jgi:hypothetical protein
MELMMNGDTRPAASPQVDEASLPDWIRNGTHLRRIDYYDCHVVRGTGSTGRLSAEDWARTVLEAAPVQLRRTLPSGWFILGLRHGSVHAPEHVLGWPIRDCTDGYIVLAATSRIGMPAELVFARQDQDWLLATLVEHDNPIVAALWRGTTRLHRSVVRSLLGSAASRVSPRSRV